MGVYVDSLMNGLQKGYFKDKKFCHLIGDSKRELLVFSAILRLNPSWIVISDSFFPCFNLTENKREQALQKGAIALEAEELKAKIAEIRRKIKDNEY